MNSFSVTLVLWVLCAWSERVQGTHDTSVCAPFLPGSVAHGPPKPKIPKSFTAHVECNLLTQNRTTDVIEYYDYPKNRGAIYQTEMGVTGQVVYNFDTDELFTVDRTSPTPCTVDELTEDNNDFLFGYKKVNQSTRMFSPTAALRFGGKNVEKYLGKAMVRGIVVHGWQTCAYWEDLDATSIVNWFFSDSSAWTESTGGGSVPVRCEVIGKSHDSNGGTKSYHHIYEFTRFRPYIDGDPLKVFETPRGLFCENRKSLKFLPISPQYFRFDAEIIVPQAKIVSHIAEWYDYQTKLVRYDYSPFPSNSNGVGNNPITEIHDFNTGVRYITNRKYGNCTAEIIDPKGFDALDVNAQTVRLRKPSQFFDLDASYQYEGVHKADLVDCDGWVNKVKNFPPGTNESTVEWLMTTNDWLINAGNNFQAGIPKQMAITATDDSGLQYVYNIYAYEHSKPAVWDFDISDCFFDSERRHLKFQLTASFRGLFVKVFWESFEHALYRAIATQAVISPVRINNLQVDYNEQGVDVTFTMLGVTPITGDVQQGAKETPLDVATNNFLSKIQSGQFVVTIPHKPQDIKLTGKPESAKRLKVREWLNSPLAPPPTGYKPGEMAAVALVMLIVGLVTGCGVVILIYRKNGGSFFPEKPKETIQGIEPPAQELK